VVKANMLTRRASLVGLSAFAGLAGCAAPDDATPKPASRPRGPITRTITGGFLSPPSPVFGVPARPGTGVFARFVSPATLALRGSDLLVLDRGLQRLWRVDIPLGTMSAIAGAPTDPGTALALGGDLSAWVLDGFGARVLRFARDGKLMQTLRLAAPLASPGSITLLEGEATLLVAAGSSRWVEMRTLGGIATEVALRADDGAPLVAQADAIASSGRDLFVLDRAAARVLLARRDGTVIARLGDGALKQPQAIAADRDGVAYVLDSFDRSVKRLTRDGRGATLEARDLGVTQPSGIAIDERWLAVADAVSAQVVMQLMPREGQP
jgi:sugar lactone lactonase YvrE